MTIALVVVATIIAMARHHYNRRSSLHPAKYNCNTLVMLVFQKSGTRGDRYLKATQMLL